jgi:hypothetical protein
MGNGISGPRMAISAIAETLLITRPQMMELRNACLRLAKPNRDKTNAGPVITRVSFHKAMKEVALDHVDIDVFDHLYTMWDTRGEGKINLLLFLSGISPLASTMDVATKLQFAIEIFDVHRTGRFKIDDAISILGGINATASYFGDCVITPHAIEVVVEDVFDGQNEIYYMDHLNEFATHPAIIQFSIAAGNMRYGGAGKAGA